MRVTEEVNLSLLGLLGRLSCPLPFLSGLDLVIVMTAVGGVGAERSGSRSLNDRVGPIARYCRSAWSFIRVRAKDAVVDGVVVGCGRLVVSFSLLGHVATARSCGRTVGNTIREAVGHGVGRSRRRRHLGRGTVIDDNDFFGQAVLVEFSPVGPVGPSPLARGQRVLVGRVGRHRGVIGLVGSAQIYRFRVC
jgi:hypothetical protein